MIICFDCPAGLKRMLDSLIAAGEYEDYSEAIVSSIRNLILIQQEVKKKGVAFMGDSVSEEDNGDIAISVQPDTLSSQEPRDRPSLEHPRLSGSAKSTKRGIPSLFLLEGLDDNSLSVPETLRPDDSKFTQYPVNEWIFGMYNRLLPAKANCRALARMISERGGHGIPVETQLESLAYDIAEQAGVLGDNLRRHDKDYNLKRDDGLSTAFPGSSPKDEKSRLRYANQFVVRVDSARNISGLLADYHLIEKAGDQDDLVRLTRPGWDFARLGNPILEDSQHNPKEKFSEEEIGFLLNHILTYVPVEASAFYSIMSIVSSGNVAPNQIDQALLPLYYAEENIPGDNKLARIATQRSGVTSRMIDLNIIRRERNGTKLKYSITGYGQQAWAELSGKVSESSTGEV